MKRLRLLYYIAFTALFPLAACQSDSAEEPEGPTVKEGMAQVRIHVSPASSAAVMRATDGNATDEEMMNIWTVVITGTDNVVEKVIACKPTGGSREIDDITPTTLLSTGTHKFYSFANMSVAKVAELLGITVSMPTMSSDDTIYEATSASGTVNADNKNVTVNGNQFNKFSSSDNNGFGSYGIPMSNVQTLTISEDRSVDLIVVRMLAKFELQIRNNTGENIKVNSATLSNVTKNDDNNLKLLPTYTTPDNANTMSYVHGDIQPNLGTGATQEDLTVTINKTIAANNTATENVTFYINESATPTNAEGLFYLTLDIGNSSTPEYRYALISNEDNEWNYIARNDYRVIPITLEDLKFEIIPYDFPPIGVYPVSVKEVDTTNRIYEFTFHDYGHFHLLPKVTKNGSDIEYAATPSGSGYQWTLIYDSSDNPDFSKSWFTYEDFGDATQTSNPNGFYRSPAKYLSGYSATNPIDGDELGGEPVWYPNNFEDTDIRPKWDPQLGIGTATYQPFIFGYIADPETALSEDKKVYHEMKIQIYNGTNIYRQMLYRFYMTLDTEQMMYSRMLGAPRVRPTHGF